MEKRKSSPRIAAVYADKSGDVPGPRDKGFCSAAAQAMRALPVPMHALARPLKGVKIEPPCPF
ncbi:hypothetical protein DL89DRAFT_267904 [Linderina pennispora]|uniref:Uncharacterized protein n=1 Tax=Linderina pennispora TaxID=61395 RepID=A0A1Y1W872_9FUNG|nr:uncharacterized protein DL89DRAFT_267904 [Linderina pennispora]ORX69741.1 hypothetical protein DL89DRAFT_267904 [Linderina pennispora]